ncbi:MAG: hypothetical protein V3S68_00905 [Dehalococcoidia bacterium]
MQLLQLRKLTELLREAESLEAVVDLANLLEEATDGVEELFDEVSYQPRRPGPLIHRRVQLGGQKRIPEATFTIDADFRDIDNAEYWRQRDEFQAEVDSRYPLPGE